MLENPPYRIIIIVIHSIVVLFSFLGFLLPIAYLPFFIVLWPIVIIHWFFNNDTCIITELEYKITNKKLVDGVNYTHVYEPNPFMERFFSYIGFKIPLNMEHNFVIIMYTITWMIGIVRLLLYV